METVYSKKTKIQSNKKLRKSFKNIEHLIKSFEILNDCNLSTKALRLFYIDFNVWGPKIANFCPMTANKNICNSKLRVSRHIFRRFCLHALLPGVKKSIW